MRTAALAAYQNVDRAGLLEGASPLGVVRYLFEDLGTLLYRIEDAAKRAARVEKGEAIARALERGREPLMRVSHELGTTLGVVGAARGQRLARGLERALRAGEPVDLPMAAASMLRELEVVVQILSSGPATAVT